MPADASIAAPTIMLDFHSCVATLVCPEFIFFIVIVLLNEISLSMVAVSERIQQA